MIEGMVSTIIPVHNRPALLREAVVSVLEQTYKNIEIIIVDDGSDDPAMPASFEDCLSIGQGKVYVLHQDNSGPGAARQHGLEHTNGEFIQFLDSDDLLIAGKFEAQVEALRVAPSTSVSYGMTRYVNDSGGVIAPWRRTGEEIMEMFPAMLAHRWWGTSTPLYRRALLNEVGPIANLVNEEDWEFDCRIAAQGVRLAWVNVWVSEQRAVATNRASEGGASIPTKLRDRARARHLILASALRANVSPEAPEFDAFVRYSFLLARQCAAAGLVTEAEKLVKRLNEVAPRRAMSFYLFAGKCVGFKRATQIAGRAHNVLRGSPEHPAK